MSLEDIATSMNTSVKMLMSTYLGLEEQTLIERSKRMYTKFPYRKVWTETKDPVETLRHLDVAIIILI